MDEEQGKVIEEDVSIIEDPSVVDDDIAGRILDNAMLPDIDTEAKINEILGI